jgi:hypothetical protein
MSERKGPWTPDEVLNQLSHTGTFAADVASALLAWEERQPLVEMTGGRGATNGTLRFAADTGYGSFPRVLLLYADPKDNHPSLKIYVKNLLSIPPYDHKKAAERFLADLRALGIPRLLDDHFAGGIWPGIRLSELTDGRIERLLAVIDRWIDDVRARRRQPAHLPAPG